MSTSILPALPSLTGTASPAAAKPAGLSPGTKSVLLWGTVIFLGMIGIAAAVNGTPPSRALPQLPGKPK